MMKYRKRSERAIVYGLAYLMSCGVFALLALPFVLAILFGDGWLYLNFITVPAYFGLMLYIDRRAGR